MKTIYTAVICLVLAHVLVLIPSMGQASPCHSFPWPMPGGLMEPEQFRLGREAMDKAFRAEALKHFRDSLHTQSERPFVEAARFAMAMLINTKSDRSEAFLETIRHLSAARRRFPDSVYGPWALCQIGDLYRQGGWFYEAKGAFEQFLGSYPDHRLVPGVLIGAGLNFLKNDQSLEAALVFRRVLDQPKWKEFHLEAALGLADGAAASKAWDQARYWYQTVQLEKPEIIRQSPLSLYLSAMTDLETGDEEKALSQFLLAFNLHPTHEDAGKALVRLSEKLLDKGNVVPGLWFAYQVTKRFPETDVDHRGRVVLLRWVVENLRKGEEAPHGGEVRARLTELGIALPTTWRAMRAEASRLVMSGHEDLDGEASYWIGLSHEIEGNVVRAMDSYARLFLNRTEEVWGQKARRALKHIIVQLSRQQDLNRLTIFVNRYQDLVPLLGPDPEVSLVMAEFYRQMALPKQALQWYDRVLAQKAPATWHENALAWKVFMADEAKNVHVAKEAGAQYEQTYPDGQWVAEVASRLGRLALAEKQYEEAIRQSRIVQVHAPTREGKVEARRRMIQVQLEAKLIQEAIEEYRSLIRDKVASPKDVLALADVLFAFGRPREAAEHYEALSSDVIETPELRLWVEYRRALSYQKVGDLDKARKLFSRLGQESATGEGLSSTILATAAVAAQNQPFPIPTGKDVTGAAGS